MTREIPLTRGYIALVDDEDFERLSRWKWYSHTLRGNTYAQRSVYQRGVGTKAVFMHNVIMEPPEGFEVDHIDRNPLNNCRSNLRLATRRQNNCNTGERPGKTSKYRGVYWRTAAKKWVAQITVNRRVIYLGRFTDELDGALAYDAAALHYHGEFATLNFPTKSHKASEMQSTGQREPQPA